MPQDSDDKKNKDSAKDKVIDTTAGRPQTQDQEKALKQLTTLLENKIVEIDSVKAQLKNFSEQLDIVLSQSHEEQQALRDLFKSLVPTQLPKIEGFSFSRKFNYGTDKGGDYFDVFPHKKDPSWSLILSSCERYATSAAVMGQIFKMESNFSQGQSSAQEDMVAFLSSLEGVGSDDRFHLFYAKINRADLSIDFYCQGAIVGFVTNAGGATSSMPASVVRLSANNPGRATLKDLNWSSSPTEMATQLQTAHIKLFAGQRLSLFSPGVLKVLSDADLARLCREVSELSIHDARNEIGFQIEKISGLAQPRQDQVVFMFEVNKNVLALA